MSLDQWFYNQIKDLVDPQYSKILIFMIENLDRFVCWPVYKKSILLWEGCTREEKYHKYSIKIKQLAKDKGITLDGRANGPAKAAFDFAGGIRPKRYGSTNTWYCKHLYSGKYPYFNKKDTLHAVKNPKHFTQSSGIVALHPISNAAFDEFPEFAWYLRALAFQKFSYDPDGVFTDINEYGFPNMENIEIIEGKS